MVHGYASQIAMLPEFARSKLAYLQSQEGSYQLHAFGAVSEVIVTVMYAAHTHAARLQPWTKPYR